MPPAGEPAVELTVGIPVYNEADNVEALVIELGRALAGAGRESGRDCYCIRPDGSGRAAPPAAIPRAPFVCAGRAFPAGD